MQIILVLLVIFLDHVGFGMVYPMFSSLLFHQDYAFVDPSTSNAVRGWLLGILLSIPAVGSFFSAPLLGSLSDRIGRRPVYLASLALAVVGYLFCVAAIYLHSIVFLICARAIVGVSMGSAAVVSATIVDLSSNENKAKNLGLYSMANGLGFALGPLLGGCLTTFGIEIPFIATAIAFFMNLILVFFLFIETNTTKKNSPIKFTTGFKNFAKAFHLQRVRILLLVAAIYCFGWAVFYEFIPLFWIFDYNFSPTEVGYLFAFGSAIFSFSSGFLTRPVLRWHGPYFALLASLWLSGPLMLLFLFNPPYVCLWGCVALFNVLAALTVPIYTTLVSNSADADSQGEILGILESVQAVAFGLSPLVAGWSVSIHLNTPVIMGAFAMLIAAFLFSCMLRHKKSLRVNQEEV
jgi:MFS transporter, DHA1 family, tetracycline resistance protein